MYGATVLICYENEEVDKMSMFYCHACDKTKDSDGMEIIEIKPLKGPKYEICEECAIEGGVLG